MSRGCRDGRGAGRHASLTAANIPRHKSYHPYNEKNKQRVREDEAKAAAEQLAREQRDIEAVGMNRVR